MTTTPGARTVLFDTSELNGVLDRMAREAHALLRDCDKLAVVGVLRRGAPLADLLTARLCALGLAPPLRLDLQVKRYADDLTLLYPDTSLTEQPQHATLDLQGHTLLLVDDVLYTGHSLLRVTDYLARKGAAAIHVAVLADRGATTLPLRAAIVGAQLHIAAAGIIECHVPPYESELLMELVQPQRSA